jgi:flavin-dependent thymidylate synthase
MSYLKESAHSGHSLTLFHEMKNTVELLGHYGGDLTHSASAWTSTIRDLTPEKIERIPNLLGMLAKGSDGKSHETPFEKSMLHFLVVSDVASHIHKIKHRIAVSINGESARYKELPNDRAYIPEDWPEEWKIKLENHAADSFTLYHECYDSLIQEHGFDKKRAKESSRYFIPYCNQTTVDIAFNFRSFMHFCKLRAVPGAQKEIREIAQAMINIVMDIPDDPFHHSIRVWGLNKLVGRE